MKKIHFWAVAVLLVCGSIFLPIVASAAPEAAIRFEDAAYMKQVYSKMAAVNSQRFTADLSILTPGGKLWMTMDGAMMTQPKLLMRGTMQTTMTSLFGSEIKTKMPFYVQELPGKMVQYSQVNQHWQKQTLAIPSTGKTSMIPNAEESMDNLKKIEFLPDVANHRLVQVTLDGAKTSALVKKSMKFSPKEKETQTMLYQILDAMGDVDYLLTIDKDSQYVLSAESDLTEPFRRAARVALVQSKMKTAQRETLQRLIEGCSVKMELKNRDFNAVPSIEIPKDVLNAPEVKPLEKKAVTSKKKATTPSGINV